MSVELIFLDRRDTINTACALLERTQPGTQVWLVIPWRSKAFRNVLNLKRIKRVAEDAAIDLRLVSAHLETRNLAREVGLPVYWRLPAKLKRQAPVRLHPAESRRVIPVDNAVQDRFQHARRFGFGSVALFLFLTGFLLATLAGVVTFFLPTAKIVLEPVSQRVEASFTLQANPRYREIDLEENVIPARSVQVILEGSGQVPATGYRDVPDQRATGEIVLANRSDRPLVVPKGTIVRTSSGVTLRFYTVTDVELPPNMQAYVRVPIIAVEPGFLVAEPFTINRLEGDLAAQVEVINDVRVEGGSFKRAPVVTYSDFDALRTTLVEQLKKKAQERFIEELQPGEFMPVATINVEVLSLKFDQNVDQESDVLSGHMRLAATGLAIQEEDIRALARRILVAKAGGQSQVIEDSLIVNWSEEIQVLERAVALEAQARAEVAPIIDLEYVKKGVRGRNVEQAAAWLLQNLPLQSPPQITLSPDLIHRLPFLTGRLQIVIASASQ